jgi:hypothetical protein
MLNDDTRSARSDIFVDILSESLSTYLVTNLELLCNLMLIVLLFSLGIDFLQYIANFLLNVIDLFKKLCNLVYLIMNMGGLFGN